MVTPDPGPARRDGPPKLSGGEQFRGEAIGIAPPSVLDFWRWAFSDLTNNALRGILAEWLVATAVKCVDQPREEWASYDLRVDDVTVEVKSAAYVQSWAQRKPSRIEFTIAPTKAWQPETGRYEKTRRRQADVYVFCLLAEQDPARIDPLDLAQWRFFVLPTKVLDAEVPTQKQIALSALLKLKPREAKFGELRQAVVVAGP